MKKKTTKPKAKSKKSMQDEKLNDTSPEELLFETLRNILIMLFPLLFNLAWTDCTQEEKEEKLPQCVDYVKKYIVEYTKKTYGEKEAIRLAASAKFLDVTTKFPEVNKYMFEALYNLSEVLYAEYEIILNKLV